MNLIEQQNLPLGTKVSGSLRDDFEEIDLVQDILLLEFPNGYAIDIGWRPHGPTGAFKITVIRNDWESVMDKFTVSTVEETLEKIQSLTNEFGWRDSNAESNTYLILNSDSDIPTKTNPESITDSGSYCALQAE